MSFEGLSYLKIKILNSNNARIFKFLIENCYLKFLMINYHDQLIDGFLRIIIKWFAAQQQKEHYYQFYLMSYFSSALQKILEDKRKSMNQTKTIIKKMKTDMPVLNTIIDYGGQEKLDDILHLQTQDEQTKIYNNFQKILMQPSQNSGDQVRSKGLSFIDYKAEPTKVKEAQKKRKRKSQKQLKTSIIVEMPQELKELKNQILSLPSVGQSRYTPHKPSVNGSRLLESIKQSQIKRYQTEVQQSRASNRLKEYKRSYLNQIRSIMSQFDSPQIKCNRYILSRHKECRKILQQQENLSKEYKRFQQFGSPPRRIIQIKNKLQSFQKTIDGTLDSELAYELTHMDNTRYDLVLKHQEEVRRLNLARFQQKQKRQKIQQSKNALSQNERSDNLGFKLNSKGKEIYTNKSKVVK